MTVDSNTQNDRKFERARRLPPARVLDVVDLDALPHVLSRTVRLAWGQPRRCALAIATSVAAAIFSILLPHLLGSAVDQTQQLLAAGSAHLGDARHALAMTAALLLAA